jgi:hypothetical protein
VYELGPKLGTIDHLTDIVKCHVVNHVVSINRSMLACALRAFHFFRSVLVVKIIFVQLNDVWIAFDISRLLERNSIDCA